jgi:hypothetical protein
VLQVASSSYYEFKARKPSARAVRDEELMRLIRQVYDGNYQVYGARKIWEELHRQGHEVARCTVERLMRRIGIRGVSRGRARRRTTVPDRAAAAARPDLLHRDFTAPAPNQRWVADFTYVPIATGTVYAAFIVDCFSRFIVSLQDHRGGSLRGHIEHRLAVGDQALRDVPPDSAASLDCPDSVGEPAAGREHLLVADTVRAVPSLREHPLPVIDDLNRGRPLVRIHADHHTTHGCCSSLANDGH